jgi:hypothetical protein
MKLIRKLALLTLVVTISGGDVFAGRGSRGSSGGRTRAPGTGSSRSSTRVGGYTRGNGTRVAPYRRTTRDRSFNNNYSTKGNFNPFTGKAGTQTTPSYRR